MKKIPREILRSSKSRLQILIQSMLIVVLLGVSQAQASQYCLAYTLLPGAIKFCVKYSDKYNDADITSFISNSYSIEPTTSNEFLYKGIENRDSINTFYGLDSFIDKLKKDNIHAFPNVSWTPITSDITFFIQTTGVYPKYFPSPYTERSLIKSQIQAFSTRSWLLGYDSVDHQLKSLYDNGAKLSNSWGLKLGESLSDFMANAEGILPGQVSLPGNIFRSALPYDVLWPEIRTIDGQEVLVPILYLTWPTINANNVEGAVLNFGEADLSYDSFIVDGATIKGKRQALLNLKNSLINTEGQITSGTINVTAGENIENYSGLISGDVVKLTADRLVNQTLVTRYDYGTGFNETAKDLAIIKSVGDITINTTSDVIASGAVFNAQGDLVIDADGRIEILTQPVENYRYQEGSFWSDQEHSIERIQSQLSGENISILAGQTITLEGAILESPGSIEILAGMGIYIVDGTNESSSSSTFDYSSGGFFGNSESEDEQSKKTELVRTLIKAGKSLVIRTEVMGNIVLRAVDFRSDGIVEIEANNGAIEFKLGKELDFYSYSYESEDVATFKMEGKGHQIETGIYNDIIAKGDLVLTADKGIRIEYEGEGELNATIDRLSQSPSLAWMKDALERDDVDWDRVKLVHENWDYKAQGLTEAASIVIAIAVAAATGGAGAAIVGAGGIGTTIAAAVVQSAVTTMATQAATSLLGNGGNIEATLDEMGSTESMHALAQSMIVAGVTAGVTHAVFGDIQVQTDGAEVSVLPDDFTNQTLMAMTSATIQAASHMYIHDKDGGWSGFATQYGRSMAMHTINTLGAEFAEQIGLEFKGGNINTATQYILHAGLGCVMGGAINLSTSGDSSANKMSCLSGAGGAVLGEYIGKVKAEQLKTDLNDWVTEIIESSESDTPPTKEQVIQKAYELKARGVDLARLGTAFAALAFEGDVSIAANTGANAAEHNAFPAIIGFAVAIWYVAWTGQGDLDEGLQLIGNGNHPIANAMNGVIEEGITLAFDEYPNETSSLIEVLTQLNQEVGTGITLLVNKCGTVCETVEVAWESLGEENQARILGLMELRSIIIPEVNLKKLQTILAMKNSPDLPDPGDWMKDPKHPNYNKLDPQTRLDLGGRIDLEDVNNSGQTLKMSYITKEHHSIPASGKLYNNGALGEEVTMKMLKDMTGNEFKPLQNSSNHGADGVFIDYENKKIYLIEVKSSINGADSASKPSTANPKDKLLDWTNKATGEGWDGRVTPQTQKFGEDIQAALDERYKVEGVWIQVEVPKVGESNENGLQININSWNN